MSEINSYIDQNRQRFLDELFDFLRIPSISADSAHKDDMFKTAEFVKEKLIIAGGNCSITGLN